MTSVKYSDRRLYFFGFSRVAVGRTVSRSVRSQGDSLPSTHDLTDVHPRPKVLPACLPTPTMDDKTADCPVLHTQNFR